MSAGRFHFHVRDRATAKDVPVGTLGLGTMDIVLPDADADAGADADGLGSVRDRLAFRGVQAADDGHTLRCPDPWGSQLRVVIGR